MDEEPVTLELAFSDAWTFNVLKDTKREKKIVFYPKSEELKYASARIEEIRFKKQKNFKMTSFITHLSNSPIESACRPIEAGDVSYHHLAMDGRERPHRFLGMRCRQTHIIKVFHVFDAGTEVYVLSFSKRQTNWADIQFKAMNSFVLNRAYLCRASQSAECNREIKIRLKPSEFDFLRGSFKEAKQKAKVVYDL